MSQQIVSTWDGVQNTNSWVHDGDVERSAVDVVELASSVAGYSAGAQAAADAASGYANTASAAVASIGGAASAAIDSVNSAGDLQINDLYSAADAETSSINALGSSWINTLTSSGGIVTSAVANEGAAQILAVTSAGGVQVALVSAAGTSAIGDLAAVTAAQSAALVSAGGYQSGLIATAGSAQVGAVQAEGGTQIAAVQLAASAQVNSATVAAISAGAAASTAQGAASAASGYAVSAGSFAAVTSGYMVSAGGYATSAGGYASAASGYALTASSYMTSAGGYASAASGSADAAAASAASIAGEVEQIGINTKNISTIQSLLNGALSTQNTDSTSAYAKTVPAKAQPYAVINEIGGKTMCWNQICKNGDFDGTTSWSATGNNGTISASNNELAYTVVNAGTGYAYGIHQTSIQNIANTHKIFITADIKSNASIVIGYDAFNNANNWGTLTTAYQTFSTIVSVSNSSTVYFCTRGGATAGDVIYFKNVRFVNLTLLYGAGNEPATVAEFQQMFPSIDPAYNAGTLISAGVTGAVSDPHNIAIPSVINATSNHAYLDADIIRRHFISPGDCLTVYVYKMSDGTSIGSECALAFWKDSTQLTSATASPNRRIYFQSGAQGGLDINLASLTPDYNKVSLYIGASAKGIDLGVVIVAGATTITQYIPSRAPVTLPIPAAVQSLPGYGWSAGNVCNEIDWVNKKYIQRVGSVDLGTLSWTAGTDAIGQYFYTDGITDRQKVGDYQYPNIASPRYTATLSDNVQNLQLAYAKGDYTTRVYVRDTDYTSAADYKTAMSGVYLYYELATPVITDISSLLSDDNLIEVEPGGSISFPSQLGDDYRLPVPSDVEYTIDLSPDTPSTDGTYTLQCTVADGVPTYEWVSA